MKRITRIVLTAAAGCMAGAGLVITPMATAPASAAGCSYYVDRGPAPVRENPSSASVIRKYKSVFDVVTGPCNGPVIQDPHNARQYFRPVYSSSCTDGICWMATQFLHPF